MRTTQNPRTESSLAVDIYGGQFTELTVVAWRDPIVERRAGAIATCSDDALVWWTPSLGPTAVLMAHRLAAYASNGTTTFTVEDLAATFGMGGGVSRLARTLVRLERFDVI